MEGQWGTIIYGAVMWGLFIVILGILVYFNISRKRWAKKQAKRILDGDNLDLKDIEKALKILAERTKDLEAQNLLREITNLSERKQ